MFRQSNTRLSFSLLILVTAISMASTAALGQDKEPLLFNSGSLVKDGSSTMWVSVNKYSVPEGKRLVIEQIFVEAVVPTGSRPQAYLRIDTGYSWGSNSQYLPLQLVSQGSSPSDSVTYSSGQPMKVYVNNPANSGTTKKVFFYGRVYDTTWLLGTGSSFSGYLEDLQ